MPNTLLPGSTRCYPLDLPRGHPYHSWFSHGSNSEPSEWQKYLYNKKYLLDERIGSSSCLTRSSILVQGGMVLNILDTLISVAKEENASSFSPSDTNENNNVHNSSLEMNILTSSNIQKAWLRYTLNQKGALHSNANQQQSQTPHSEQKQENEAVPQTDTISDCISNQFFQLDLITRKWCHITTYVDDEDTPLFKPRMCHSIMCDDSFLYCFGGLIPTSTASGDQMLLATNELWQLDLYTKTWALLSDPLSDSIVSKRYNHSMHIIYEKKQNNTDPTLPDFATSETKSTPSTGNNNGTGGTASTANNNNNAVDEYTKKLVIIGGLNSLDKPLHTIDVYNLESNAWESTEGGLYKNLTSEDCSTDEVIDFNTESNVSFAFSKNKSEVPSIVIYKKNENNPLKVVPLSNSLQPKKHEPFDILTDDFDSKLKSLNRKLRFPKGGIFGLNLIISGYCQFEESEKKLSNQLNHEVSYLMANPQQQINPDPSSRTSTSQDSTQKENHSSFGNSKLQSDFLEFRSYCYNILSGKWIELNTTCIDKETCSYHLVTNSFIWESHHKALFLGSKNNTHSSTNDVLYRPLLQKFDHLISIGLTVTSLFHQNNKDNNNSNLMKTHEYLLENLSATKSTKDLNTKSVMSIMDEGLSKEDYSNLKRFKDYAEYFTPTSDLTANNSVLPAYAMVLGKASLSIYADKVSDIELVSSDGKATWCSLALLRKRWGRYFDTILAQGYTAAVNEFDSNSGKNSKFSSISTANTGQGYKPGHGTSVGSIIKERHLSKSNPSMIFKNFTTHTGGTKDAESNDNGKSSLHKGSIDLTDDKSAEEHADSPLSKTTSADINVSTGAAFRKPSISSNADNSSASGSTSKHLYATTSSSSGMVFRIPFHDNSQASINNENGGENSSIKSKNMYTRKLSESRRPSAHVNLMFNNNQNNGAYNISPHSSREASVSSGTPPSLTSNDLTSHINIDTDKIKPLSAIQISAKKLPPATQAPTDLPPNTSFAKHNLPDGIPNLGASHFLQNVFMSERRRSSIHSIDLISEKSSLRNSLYGSRRSSLDRAFHEKRKSSLSDVDHLVDTGLAMFNSPQSASVSSQQNAESDNAHKNYGEQQNVSSYDSGVSQKSSKNDGAFSSLNSKQDNASSVLLSENNNSNSVDLRSMSTSTCDSFHSISGSINNELEPLMIPRLLYMPWTNASVNAFVEFFYTGQVNPKWPLQPVSLDVFVMAKLYEVPLLYDLMSEVIFSIIGKKEASLTSICENLQSFYLKSVESFFKDEKTSFEMEDYLENNVDYQELLKLEKSLRGVDDGYLDYDLLKKASRAVSVSTDGGTDISRGRSSNSRYSRDSLYGSASVDSTTLSPFSNNIDKPMFRKSSGMRFGSTDSGVDFPGEFGNLSPRSSMSKPSGNNDLKLAAIKNISSQKNKASNLSNTFSKIDEFSDESGSTAGTSTISLDEENASNSDSIKSSSSSSSSGSDLESPTNDNNENLLVETSSAGDNTSQRLHYGSTEKHSSFKDKYGFGLVSLNKASKILQQQYVEESIDPLTPVEDEMRQDSMFSFNKRSHMPSTRTSSPFGEHSRDDTVGSKQESRAKLGSTEPKTSILTLEMLASPRSKPPVEYIMELIYDTTVYLYDIVLMVRCRNCIELTKSLKNIRSRLNNEIIMLDTQRKKRNSSARATHVSADTDGKSKFPTTTQNSSTTLSGTLPFQLQNDPKLLKIFQQQQRKDSITSVSSKSSLGSATSTPNMKQHSDSDTITLKEMRRPETMRTMSAVNPMIKLSTLDDLHKVNTSDNVARSSTVGSKLSQVAHSLNTSNSEDSNQSLAKLTRNKSSLGSTYASSTNSDKIVDGSHAKNPKTKQTPLSTSKTSEEVMFKKKSNNSFISFFSKKKGKPSV